MQRRPLVSSCGIFANFMAKNKKKYCSLYMFGEIDTCLMNESLTPESEK